jgi:hypothetical protein
MTAFLSVATGLGAVLAATGWGWAIATGGGRSPSRDPDRLLLYPIVGLLAAALLGSLLWVTGGFTAPVAWFLVAGGLLLALGALRADGAAAYADFRSGSVLGPGALILWLVTIIISLPNLLAPDTAWDSEAYHLIIARDAAQHGFLPFTIDHVMAYLFWGSHTLIGWGYLLAGPDGDTAGRTLLAAAASLCLAFAARRIGRRFHPRIGLIACALVLTTPVWMTQWGTACVDFVLFGWGACGLALATERGRERRWFVVGLLCLALCASTKQLGLVAPITLAFVWLGNAFLTRSTLPAAKAALLAVCCLVAIAPWLWKNYEALGNPFLPFGTTINPEALERHRLFDNGEEPKATWVRGFDDAGRIVLRCASGSPWSATCSPLLFCLWPFAVWGRRQPWMRGAWAGSLCAFAFVLVLAQPALETQSVARYFFDTSLWAYFLAAVALHRLAGSSTARARSACLLIVAVSLPTLWLSAARAVRKVPVIIGAQSIADFWKERNPGASVLEYLNETLEPEGRVFCIGDRISLLRIPRHQFIRSYEAHWARVRTADELRRAWDVWGITHVYVNNCPATKWYGVDRAWITNPEGVLKGWRLVKENGAARLYQRTPYVRSGGPDPFPPLGASRAHGGQDCSRTREGRCENS